MSLTICISVGFSILLLILDKLVSGMELYLSTMLTVSVIWVDLDFLFFKLCQFYFFCVYPRFYWIIVISLFCWLCQSSFSAEIGEVIDFPTTLGFFTFFFNCVSSPFIYNRVNTSDQRLFDIIQIPTCFSNLFNWCIIFILWWDNGIGLHDFSAWYSPSC